MNNLQILSLLLAAGVGAAIAEPDPDPKEYGGWLAAERFSARVSQLELAEKADLSRDILSRIERGVRSTTPDERNRIARALGGVTTPRVTPLPPMRQAPPPVVERHEGRKKRDGYDALRKAKADLKRARRAAKLSPSVGTMIDLETYEEVVRLLEKGL